jgi:hypothetical protein
MDESDVGGSGLNLDDWVALRDVFWPFIHAENPAHVPAPRGLPKHLKNHRLVRLIRKYRDTSDKKYLDQAGQLLIPTSEPFGWYVPLTK